MKVKEIINIDGYKFLFDDKSWISIRLSGIELIIICYVESKDE